VAAQDAIECHRRDSLANFGGYVITEEIVGQSKRFIVRADDGIMVGSPFNGAVKLKMVSPGEITNRSAVTALSIKIRSCAEMDGMEVPSGPVQTLSCITTLAN
jgi:hypothetical protein